MAQKSGMVHSIQYLRGISVLIVLAVHGFSHPAVTRSVLEIFVGRLAVITFFVISGFIMCVTTGTGRFSVAKFAKNRVVRVVPMYWLITLFVAAIALGKPDLLKTTVFQAEHFIASLLFIPYLNPAEGIATPLVKLGWSLNYEMFFYLLFALTASLQIGLRAAVLVAVLVGLPLLGLAFPDGNILYSYYTGSPLLGFAAGVALGWAFLTRDLTRIPAWAIGLGLVVAVAVYIYLDRIMTSDLNVANAALMVAVALPVAVAGIWLELRGRLPRSRFLHFFGDASYSLYLTHMFGIGFAVVVARKLLGASFEAYYLPVVFVAIAAGGLAGALTYLWVEKPLLAFLGGRRRKAREAAAAAARQEENA